MLPELILFENANFEGRHKHVYGSVDFLADFNDLTSSFVILQGHWEFFLDAGSGHIGQPSYGPGMYPWVGAVGLPNDGISGVRLVSASVASLEHEGSSEHEDDAQTHETQES